MMRKKENRREYNGKPPAISRGLKGGKDHFLSETRMLIASTGSVQPSM